jgi:UDP-N-acetylmuramoyl-L-alanyl-D-glutamate--2,6-diaminopimelate ligase
MSNIKAHLFSYNIETETTIKHIEWKVQESTKNTILFYNFNDSSELELNKFEERIRDTKYAICITNYSGQHSASSIFSMNTDDYKSLQEKILNELYPCDFLEERYSVGVTGTNGKTTTVYLLAQLGIQAGYNILTIGTLGVLLNNNEVSNYNLTTPSYIDIRKEIFKHKNDFDIFAMELSSHALSQGRLGSLKFDSIGWTNFSQDHLDYHETMDDYFNAKAKIWNYLKEKNSKVLVPDKQKELINRLESKNIKITNTKIKTTNPFFKVDYNLENLSLSLGLIKSYKNIDYDIENLTASPGRFNIIPHGDSYIIIDYAHTPDGLNSICSDLKKSFKKYNLITIFGCGGDRDRDKRPLMANAASKKSDFVILTSDNPRFEDPNQIIGDASVGLGPASHIEVDRKKAIQFGISRLKGQKSILLIAGKGHEPYLDVQGTKYPYNDADYITELIND